MELRDEDIRHIARLARLRLTAEELEPVRQDLNRVLDYVAQLQQLELAEVPPTRHAVDLMMPLRPDQVEPSLPPDAALANGPVVLEQMFVVPRIMEEGGEPA
ncbi:glutamyl-tRNA(Gln) amidotransferase subunit C [Sulfobacillus acidophilus TPY]|jgi:aspartyl-tRNA(Asn)/glutamyl-tRNA(Gln) amidotransferase subunit C|uniref:Aspartyl/glutamyl-tRNA(Asn/Gln) amidotransferase subunit C n=1 Tax=Sulfobacillus acidophilus (strain ATCC 700253 / DSM 10332 / NAL) TaxID=679936 RepID=G8TXC0_SULAD|nr:glutamyl-tRNA(Gln) amidotransferase subunit C [Sulfobacillus acidophilus TPY]AEW06122.1 aspartyl/glutamyl-tRNA(Asn/Gln) amidotransferase subunit C [Sulfobacillus acidophilus DSM 10332]